MDPIDSRLETAEEKSVNLRISPYKVIKLKHGER